MGTERYQVILLYDGTDFSGMQRQANARSVQGVVEDALRKIGWDGKSILAAGRTDAGVHAEGQVIAFDMDWKHSPEDLLKAMNANLPADAAAKQAVVVADDFHPRYDAISRRYRYQVFFQAERDPLRERYAWRVWPEPDIEKLQTCAQLFNGEHDFSAFGTPPKEGGVTIRQVFESGWLEKEDGLVYEVRANAFLYHMVRRMVIIQVEVGQGRLDVSEAKAYLKGIPGEMVPGLAPPHGLFLEEVVYR